MSSKPANDVQAPAESGHKNVTGGGFFSRGLAEVDPAVFAGQATNVSLTLDDVNGCHAEVGARILNGGGPGFTGLAYRSSDHRLSAIGDLF